MPVKRYDVYIKRVCSKCGKVFYKEKYKSNLKESQIKIYHWYGRSKTNDIEGACRQMGRIMQDGEEMAEAFWSGDRA